jgi:RNA polymerase sigma factor (sigma-70 family)
VTAVVQWVHPSREERTVVDAGVGDTVDASADTDLVAAARDGHQPSFATLVDRWMDRCWEVAWRILRDRDLAADVAQETMITAWERLETLERAGSFGGWVLRIARNRALNRLERERRAVPTDDERALEATNPLVVGAGPERDVEHGELADLVWAASAALGERDASVLDLHLRHDLGPAELAEALGVTPNNAHQVLFRLRSRLGAAVRAHVLWHHGSPRCDELAELLEAAGITSFGPPAVKAISRHAEGCPTCEDERAAVLAPAALFAAVPLVALPSDLRARLVASLGDAGVPVPGAAPGGSTPRVAATRRAAVAAVVAAVALLASLAVGLGLLWGGDAEHTVTDDLADDVAHDDLPPDTSTTTAAPTTIPSSPVAPVASVPPPSTDAPPVPGSEPVPGPGPTPGTQEPLAPPPPTPPSTTSTSTTTTTTTSTTEAPTAPTVDRLEVEAAREELTGCPRVPHRIRWATTGATSATIQVGEETPQDVPPDGELLTCARPGTPVTLTATGPGGSTRARTTV